jgi:NAD(P)-dependent dehydrogenase (short-subunit alcohol dehydrogenase family)
MSTSANIDDSLDGQTALVTGATGGLGRAIALELARAGAAVVVHGRDAERGAAVVQAIEAGGGRARFAAADLGEADGVSALAEAAGAVDILVNNAGFSAWGPTAGFEAAAFDRMFAANVRAPFLLTGALAPGMVERGHGSIVNIGSMAGSIGLAEGAAYGATKASLASLAQSWAAEFSVHGVRVNTVAPGPIHTRPEARELFDALGATTAMNRAAQPEEIAAVVAFVASPAASYMTGATIAVDGGRTAI